MNRTLFFLCLVCHLISLPQLTSAQDLTIYVWDFNYRSGKTDDLTTSFTDEFEEALLQTDCCEVLQRRNYSRLFQQRENEQAISGVAQLSSNAKDRLKDIRANTVIFGEIFDDARSGQVKISVSFEKFSGSIDKRASVYMAKFDINNPQKREEAMAELIDELRLGVGTRPSVAVENVDDWTFDFKGCQRIGKDVKCSYVITSNYRDREFTMNSNSKAYDEFNYEYSRTKNVQLANKSSYKRVTLKLIDGIPASGFIVFENVSSRATKFPLLEFSVYGEDLSTRVFQFRNVQIE